MIKCPPTSQMMAMPAALIAFTIQVASPSQKASIHNAPIIMSIIAKTNIPSSPVEIISWTLLSS